MKNGHLKLDISIVVPGLPFNGETFDKQSLGGSESAGYYVARALGKRGHNVTVFCNTQPVQTKEVDYLPLEFFRHYAEFTQHDACIVQRAPEYMTLPIKSRFTALWCHDLAQKRSQGAVTGTAFNYDKLFVLSDFMRKQYEEVYGEGVRDLLYQTRNGVDLDLVRKAWADKPKDVTRNPLSLIYSARPERGLDVLLGEIMPRILKEEPNARLFLSTYENRVDQLAPFYTHCKMLADRLGGAVVFLGHLSKEKLYQAYITAGLYAYPMPSKLTPTFDEISCISLMEAQACGLPVVSSARGALVETLHPHAGTLIKEDVHTEAYYDSFANACLQYMRNPGLHTAASVAGMEHAKQLSWDGVAEQWEELILTTIKQKSSDLATLANHFWRRSDIYAARECLKRLPVDDPKSRWVRERVYKDWAFLDEQDGFRKQYERIGGTHDDRVIDWSPREPRYDTLMKWLQTRTQDVSSVLDYGCAHGGYATNLLKALPHLRVTGVDIDLHGINMAHSFAEKLGVASRWTGVVGDYSRLADPVVGVPDASYDMAMAQEVLEHVEDPGAVLAALEAKVKDGGWVYITVPFGPWEYTDYKRYPYRAHIWEFDLHDLQDLFGEKLKIDKDGVRLSTSVLPFGRSNELGDALGWWVITYRVTAATRGKLGKIDMDRKLWCQAPRQTVSATIMAGGHTVEETLLWCLRSIEHVADEVVIADSGMSDIAKQVLSLSPFNDGRIIVVPAPDPKVEGFETPRNIALAHASQDWVLWIDTDEKVLDAGNVHRYLRDNIYQGYSITQHHFAVDTHFDPDMPVRMFRNNGKMRFYGMIHEHPELAMNEGPGRTLILPNVHIAHVGYLIESTRKQRFTRNLPMLRADEKKYPRRRLQKHMIMRDNMLLAAQELQANGGVITDSVVALCEETIKLYREYFMAKGHFTNSDPIGYYSQACSILASRDGKGFDAAFSFTADKSQAQLATPQRIRFANSEDALAEIAFRVKESTAVLEHKYY